MLNGTCGWNEGQSLVRYLADNKTMYRVVHSREKWDVTPLMGQTSLEYSTGLVSLQGGANHLEYP